MSEPEIRSPLVKASATADRPMWPPGCEIVAQCFDIYAQWEWKWSEDLEGIDDPVQRTRIYGHMNDGIDIDLAKVMVEVENRRD